MNVLFLSPNFPVYNFGFAKCLMERGVQVLAVGDSVYDRFSAEQKSSVTEYYFVTSLEDYDSVYRAAAFFIHKYGRIDKVVSLNAYWQPLASALRRDYGIDGVTEAKPLEMGKYNVTYEALLDDAGMPILEMSRAACGVDGSYTLPEIDRSIRNAAIKAVSASGIRNDFVTVELKRAGVGYSVVNTYAAPDAFAPDIFNYVFAFDVFSAWAYLTTGGEVEGTSQKQNIAMVHTVDKREYPGVSAEYFGQLEDKILQESAASEAMVEADGDIIYILRVEGEEEARGILSVFAGKEVPPFVAAKITRNSSGKADAAGQSIEATEISERATEKLESEKMGTGRKPGRKPSIKATDQAFDAGSKAIADKPEKKKSIKSSGIADILFQKAPAQSAPEEISAVPPTVVDTEVSEQSTGIPGVAISPKRRGKK